MFLRRIQCFPLLLTGLLASLFLVLYLTQVVKDRSSIFENTSCHEQPAILYKETEKTHSLASAENLFKLYDGVETFVMFIGYQRSSHSLVGAILDAHPEIIIPHEYGLMTRIKEHQSLNQSNLQRYALFYDLHQLSMKQAMFGIRAQVNYTKPTGELSHKYKYHVSGLWQGGYQKRIKVIGDKKGGVTSEILIDPNNMSKLEAINQIVQVPMKFIHVTRNPFDNIATMMLKKSSARNAAREAGVIVNITLHLERSIANYFELAAANQRVRERYGHAVLDIPGHETVLRPRETLQRLCDHLGVSCSEDYFEKCSKLMYGTPSVTRNKVVWSGEQIKRVAEMMKSYPFLKDYSFDKYPS